MFCGKMYSEAEHPVCPCRIKSYIKRNGAIIADLAGRLCGSALTNSVNISKLPQLPQTVAPPSIFETKSRRVLLRNGEAASRDHPSACRVNLVNEAWGA